MNSWRLFTVCVLGAAVGGANDATALTVATWIGATGDYEDASNWDSNPLIPNNGVDDVTAIISGNLTVTLDGATAITVDTFNLGDRTRFIASGVLTSFASANGIFDSGAQVIARNGATIDIGDASIDGASLIADDIGGGANASISSNATSYTGSAGFNRDRELAADGNGTRLDLANVHTLIRNSGSSNNLNIRARDGGVVDLSALTNIVAPAGGLNGGTLLFQANGASTIALSNVTDFDEIFYEVTDGGNISGQVHSVTSGRLTVGGASDVLTDLASLNSVANSIVTAQDGASVDLGNANLDSASLLALKENGSAAPGATITTSATSYTGTDGFNQDRTLKADGTGTMLDLSSLTSLVRNRGSANNLDIRALNGGTVDLRGLSTFTDAPAGNAGASTLVHASDGGTLVLDGISDFDDIRYEVLGGGNITGEIHTLINGVLTIGGASDSLTNLNNLTSVENSAVTARDGAIVDLGSANIDRASLFAAQQTNSAAPNAILRSSAASYTGTDGFNLDRTLQADGTGTHLDLSELSNFTRNRGAANHLDIVARDGGRIDLSGLSSFTDAVGGNNGATLLVQAQADSTVMLDGITEFDNVRYEALGGGDITGQIHTFTNGRLIIGGASDVTTDLSLLTSVTDTAVIAEDGAQVLLASANIDRASLIARKENSAAAPNAKLSTAATSYTGTDGFNLDREFEADGTGTILDLSTLTSLVRNRGTLNNLFIRAIDGGQVDLSGLAGFTDAPGGNEGSALELVAETGGEILLNGVAVLDGIDYTALDGGRIISQLTSFLNGRMTIGGASDVETDLSTLLSAAGSTVISQGGAQVDLGTTIIDQASLVARIGSIGGTIGARLESGASAYAGTDGFNFDREFSANGAATFLDLSALTTLVRNRGSLNELSVRASDGGVVDLSNLSTLTNPSGGLDGSRIFVEAEDADSEVRLSALTSIEHAEVTIDNGARVDLGELGHFAHGTVKMDGTANAQDLKVADTFVLGQGGTIDMNESPAAFIIGNAGGPIVAGAVNVAGGIFGGNGTVIGNVTNNGTIRPGESPGTLIIDGDYVQQIGAKLAVEIESESLFDVLKITGSATLAGTLEVSFLSSFDPGVNVFIILSAEGGVQGVFDNVFFNGALVDVFYGDDFVQLNMGPVPLPPAMWLFSTALLGLVARCRRGDGLGV